MIIDPRWTPTASVEAPKPISNPRDDNPSSKISTGINRPIEEGGRDLPENAERLELLEAILPLLQ